MKFENVKFIFGGLIGNNAYDVEVNGDVISAITPACKKENCNYVTLPYIDVHTHGGAGHDVSELTKEALDAIGDYLLYNGIGAYLPTFVATPLGKLDEMFLKLRNLSPSGAEILGAHIEGPYISLAKKGAQPAANILTAYDPKDAVFFEKNKDILKIVTLCPATKNAPLLVKTLVGNGIKAEAGHDDSVDTDIIECMKNGLDGATHIYCASSGFRRLKGSIEKHLGLNECALLFDEIYTEVIADGVHISENLFDFIYKNKGYRKIILVSDSLAPAGAPCGKYLLGDDTPVITDGTAAYLEDKSALAGSVTNVAKTVENVVSYGVPLAHAVYAATETPRKYLSLPYDALSCGSTASFNVLDEKGKLLHVVNRGRTVR